MFIAVGLGLGLAVPEFTRGPALPSRPVAEMLLATGFGVLGAATVIFSVLFLVVQWAATTFTPRLTLFRDAPIVWRTFAFAVGLTVFCATAALTIANRDEVSVVVPISAGVLLLLLLTLLRTLLLKAVAAIQLAPVLGSITEQGRHNLAVLYTSGPGDTRGSGGPGDTDRSGGPGNAGGPGDGRGPRGPADPDGPRSAVCWPKAAAVLQRVDVDLLAGAAREANAVVVLRVTPGTTMQHGTTVAEVYDGDLPGSAVLRGLETGAERVFDQDPGLAFRLLADIALRALSPAVNDPATAVQALDAMEDLLRRPARARSRGRRPLGRPACGRPAAGLGGLPADRSGRRDPGRPELPVGPHPPPDAPGGPAEHGRRPRRGAAHQAADLGGRGARRPLLPAAGRSRAGAPGRRMSRSPGLPGPGRAGPGSPRRRIRELTRGG
ncbi:DUF2254 family protein [Streptomyces sp. NPDC006446]|uniref:DUF2254 family protein n=1 Tax=Streptomyces sp. NPDC006446 TaxID=3154301 RepID=UPI0033A617D0